ncbi:hypothetical protein [Halalkalicoccus sp. NIPERK01]|uniref:hypothetical protein n=1 Tax=Halalkalicoccus sp. NIPERK01 TaxID=3053469 RepID=UPI00256EDD09|nr:hypothetical protein [Halalkalicoccus sp. NIPERK01]MDL5362895.1 hypothetical protein [Halalkalicoccus sp. NIPERK01]
MSATRIAVALGAGLSAFLVVGALTTELLAGTIAFSALVGLPAGALAAFVVFALVSARFDGIGRPAGRAGAAIAGFGYAVLAYAALAYVAAGIAFDVHRAVGLAAVVAAAIHGWLAVRARSGGRPS